MAARTWMLGLEVPGGWAPSAFLTSGATPQERAEMLGLGESALASAKRLAMALPGDSRLQLAEADLAAAVARVEGLRAENAGLRAEGDHAGSRFRQELVTQAEAFAEASRAAEARARGEVAAALARQRGEGHAEYQRGVETGAAASAELVAHLRAELEVARAGVAAGAAQSLDAVAQKLEALLGGSSSAKGRSGEVAVAAALERAAPGCAVTPRSHVPECGDFLFESKDGQLALLVESKNVARVQKRDLDKFVRDLESAPDVRGGLFLSLAPAPLPRLGAFAVRIHDSKPAVYVTDLLACPAALAFALEALDFLVRQAPPATAPAEALEAGDDDGGDTALEAAAEGVRAAFEAFQAQAGAAAALRAQAAALLRGLEGLDAAAAAALDLVRRLWAAHPRLAPATPMAPAPPAGFAAAAETLAARLREEPGLRLGRPLVLEITGLSEAQLRRLHGSRALMAEARRRAGLAP